MNKILYGIGAFLALLILIGFLLPRESRFVVAADIDANPATVFALVNSMRRRLAWSPITDKDPNARVEVSGPPRGIGSTLVWDGGIAGSGREEIVDSRPYDYVETVINAGEPGETRTWFELDRIEGAGTHTRWGIALDHGLNVIGRYSGLVVRRVLAADYRRRLEQLAAFAETLPRTDFSDLEVEAVRVESVDIAYIRTTSPPDPARMSEALGESYFEVLRFIDRHGLRAAGAPISIARAYQGAALRFDAGIPVAGVEDETPQEDGPVRLGRTYGGNAIRASHRGSYRRLAETHRKVASFLAATGLTRNGDPWESYVNDPTEADERELLTYLYYPVREPD